jgi:hypothetical protein
MNWRYLMLILILGEALVGIVLLWHGQRIAGRRRPLIGVELRTKDFSERSTTDHVGRLSGSTK